MNPLNTLQAVIATRENQTGRQRLYDVRNIGKASAVEAAGEVAHWLVLLRIANCLTDAQMRATVLEMLQTEERWRVEMFLRGLVR